MRIVTGAEMAEIDRRTIEEIGIPAEALMESAGYRVALATWELLGMPVPPSPGSVPVGRTTRSQPRIVVLCGRGNNGGDGFVAARYLTEWGARVRVYTVAESRSRSGDGRGGSRRPSDRVAARQLEILRKLGMDVPAVTAADLSKVKLNLAMADAVVDALLGTGFRGEPEGLIASLIDAINEAGAPVVAVDIPSGVNSAGGPVVRAVRAHVTVTFGLPKLGTILYPGADYCGRLQVVDIGFPRRIADDGADLWLLNARDVREWLPARPADSHKGTYGHVLVVAGSPGMTGAGQLAVRGAHRAGAGLVTWAVPRSLQASLAPASPETMTVPWPEDAADGTPSLENWLENLTARGVNGAVVGPGLGQNGSTALFVRTLLARLSVPAVVDADGLNILAGWEGAEELRRRDGAAPWILTPHPGEMARLSGRSRDEILAAPVAVARTVAARYRAVVVLKGARTVVAEPGGRAWINATGNPVLATGGTGDVLAGAIGALLAQGCAPWQAAAAGVYLHGVAADLAARELGDAGALTREIADRLPRARLAVLEETEDIPVRHRLNR